MFDIKKEDKYNFGEIMAVIKTINISIFSYADKINVFPVFHLKYWKVNFSEKKFNHNSYI